MNAEKKQKSLMDRLVWILNILSVFGLLLSYLAGVISPETLWWLALFGLGFGLLLIINILFIFYWLIRKQKRFLFSLIAILLGTSRLLSLFQVSFSSPPADAGPGLKVMSFNVRLFDLYNWFHNHVTRGKIFDFLEAQKPDIVCFQEFYSSERKEEQYRNDQVLKKIIAPYAHIEYTLTLRDSDHWGIATYSRYPVINTGCVRFQDRGGNVFIYTDIVRGSDTIRVFNTHLESVRFRWEDYRFIENLGNDEMKQDELAGGIQILRRLKRAFMKRASQVRVLRDTISNSPYPVVLCGDFNDTPTSYTYAVLSDILKDTFRESGNGSGKTYAGPFPSFRIDYIFHDKRFRSYDYTTYREQLSDHYPISCTLYLRP